MRRFLLTYSRSGQSIEIEGVLFSTKKVVLAFDPLGDTTDAREFTHLAVCERYLKDVLGKFGVARIKWIDGDDKPWR